MSKDKKTYRTLSEKEIRDYLQGRLSEGDAHRLERHALDSPFEQEALEGLRKFDQDTVSGDIAFLKEKIRKRVRRRTYYIWKVAAVAALLIASVAVLWMTVTVTKTTDTIAMNEAERGQKALGPEAREEIPAPDIPRGRPERPVPPAASPHLREEMEAAPIQKKETEQTTPQEEPAAEAFREVEANVWYPDKKTVEEVIVEEPVMTLADGLAMNDLPQGIQERREGVGEQTMQVSGVVAEPGAKRTFARSRAVTGAVAVVSDRVSGTVTDEYGDPLPGVSVTVKDIPVGTVTDIEGRYSIQLPAGTTTARSTARPESELTLQFAFIGMQTEEVAVGGREEVNMVLQADVMALSEVVVIGYGMEEANEVGYEGARLEARPEGGIGAYKEYLEEARRYPPEARQSGIEGKVVLKVNVSASGEIEHIEVKRSLGYGCDEEAIRLVKEGPRWLPAKKDGENVPGTVRVKIKF